MLLVKTGIAATKDICFSIEVDSDLSTPVSGVDFYKRRFAG